MKKFIRHIFYGFLGWTAFWALLGGLLMVLLNDETPFRDYIERFFISYGIMTGIMCGIALIILFFSFVMIVIASRGHPIEYIKRTDEQEESNIKKEALRRDQEDQENELIEKVIRYRREWIESKKDELEEYIQKRMDG